MALVNTCKYLYHIYHKYYDDINNVWIEIAATNAPLANNQGYFVFVRGDAEIDELETRLFIKRIKNIFWFDVSMTISLAVQVVTSLHQCLECLCGKLQCKTTELVEMGA